MVDKAMTLTEKTLLPVSMVLIIIGGTSWLTTMYSQLQAQAAVINEMRTRQESFVGTLEHIDKRLARIEGKLGVIQDD